VHARKCLRKTARLSVDDEVYFALSIKQHIFRAVARNRDETKLLEQAAEGHRVRCRILDKLKPIRAERIVPQRLVGRAHGHRSGMHEEYAQA